MNKKWTDMADYINIYGNMKGSINFTIINGNLLPVFVSGPSTITMTEGMLIDLYTSCRKIKTLALAKSKANRALNEALEEQGDLLEGWYDVFVEKLDQNQNKP